MTACAQQTSLYHYGNTSHYYYRAVKFGDEKSLDTYKISLENLFYKEEKAGRKVAPGLYCDYAMILMRENQEAKAREYFEKEKQNFEESTALINFMLMRYFGKI
ncbi:MAG: DUF4810 domain-containing protein [Candidatus Cloacimonetes bacterium]|nr:DUF4810 domain-containing protein [Candidatus Cloacimonadota bacterium]